MTKQSEGHYQPKPTSVACAKCGRTFRSASEYRYNAQGRPICRKPCREAKP